MKYKDSIDLRIFLTKRYCIPVWQFTLSASTANTAAVRIARQVTWQGKVLLFEGKYHGHFDGLLVSGRDNKLRSNYAGLPHNAIEHTELV